LCHPEPDGVGREGLNGLVLSFDRPDSHGRFAPSE
jgi:hypothetical protein